MFNKFFKSPDNSNGLKVGDHALCRGMLVKVEHLNPVEDVEDLEPFKDKNLVKVKLVNMPSMSIVVEMETLEKFEGDIKDIDDTFEIVQLLAGIKSEAFETDEELLEIKNDVHNVIEKIDKNMDLLCTQAIKREIILTKKEMAILNRMFSVKFANMLDVLKNTCPSDINYDEMDKFIKHAKDFMKTEDRFMQKYITPKE